MGLTEIKDAALIAAPFTGLVINTFLKPALEGLADSLKKSKSKIVHDALGKFEDYLIRSYERQAYIKTLVFQNSKKLIDELYVPLTVMNSDTERTVKIENFPEQFLPANNKILLVDTAGMGKSTVSRYLFLKCIEANKGIPIFLELRQLRYDTTIVDLINSDINKINEVFDKDLLLTLISRGDFVFFFDGFDEIPLKEREFATQHLQDFIAKASNNKFLITSRQDPALAAFADFQRFVIKPLRQNEAFDLLEKYDVSGVIASALIEKLKEEQHRGNLKSFLSNPLLVSLLFKAYDFKPTLPLRADVFYRQVYEALFENHDLAKGSSFIREKKSKLNSDDFSRVLRALAIKTVTLGKVEYNYDELLNYVSEARMKCSGLAFSDSDFVKDLIVNVPLFIQDGLDYRWSHKSFQEYFSALHVAMDVKSNADKYLQRFVDSKEQLRFINILELYYDIDTVTFHRALTKRLIDEFVAYNSGETYSYKYYTSSKEEVVARKLISFGRRYVLFSLDAVNKIAEEDVKFDPTKAQNAIRRYIQDNGYLLERERLGSSTIFPNGSALVIIQTPNVLVMELLGRKKAKFIIDVKQKIYKNFWKNYGLVTSASIATGNMPQIVTEDINDELNSVEKFGKTTYLLVDNEKNRLSIDSDAANDMLQEINRLLAEDDVDNVLAGI